MHRKSLELKVDLGSPRSLDVSARERSGGQTALSAALQHHLPSSCERAKRVYALDKEV